MINCNKITFEFSEISFSIQSSKSLSIDSEEVSIDLNDVTFNITAVNQKSNLKFAYDKHNPIIFCENQDYFFKVEFKEAKDLIPLECFEIIERNTNRNIYLLRFNSMNYVGVLNISFLGVFSSLIEVESIKINYQEEYNNLLLKITELDVDLTTRARSIFEVSATLGDNLVNDHNLLNTKFAFLKSKILSGEFELLYNHFLRKPIVRIKEQEEIKNVWEVDSFNIGNYIDGLFDESILDQNGNRIPAKIQTNYFDDEIDTVENQFIKYVLEFIIQLLEKYKSVITNSNLKILELEIDECLHRCYNVISNPIFNLISRLKYFPSKSNSLQVKYPYRDIFYIYMMLFYEVEIQDDTVKDSMSIPLKDLPKLYEYWCLLSIIEILNKEFGNSDLDVNEFVKYNSTNLCYVICPTRNGMVYKINDSKKLVLYYQKNYSVNNIIYEGRSYSHNLDPDISLELFIRDKLVSIIHFDSKYKLESLTTFKNEDIDKMHTYKDAILGTIGAYVLYPGNVTKSFIQEERNQTKVNQYFPSVGAFVLNIANADIGSEHNAVLKLINEFVRIESSLDNNGIFTNSENDYNYIKRLID
jgi:predicted component of viral defense system (DUF524 family)